MGRCSAPLSPPRSLSPVMNEAWSDRRLARLLTPKFAETNETFTEISLKSAPATLQPRRERQTRFKQLGGRREHISLSRALSRVRAGYGGRRIDSANCRLSRLRLGIDREAKTLISNSGVDAYRIARRRACESSSQQMAKDWSRVAVAIARKTRKPPTMLAAMFPQLADRSKRPAGSVRKLMREASPTVVPAS